jgi:hypothetical protein
MKAMLLCLLLMTLSLRTWAQEEVTCPGAPPPRLIVQEQARVTLGASNNVRDLASRNGNLIGSIPAGGIFTVLDGPVCADNLTWWEINYEGLIGWTAEGTAEGYWLERVAPAETTTSPQPADTPMPVPAAEPVAAFEPPLEVVNVLTVGGRVRVINDDPLSETIALTIRAEPARSAAALAQALEGDLLTITGGPQEADGLRWWQVDTAGGTRGWVVEGFINAERENAYERTLLPLCTAEGKRVVFRLINYIMTSTPDGEDICILDRTNARAWTTFSDSVFYFENTFLTTSDEQHYIYADAGLIRLSRDGSERLRLTDGSVRWASLSPDGQRVAIATGSTIATIRLDGTNFANVTQGSTGHGWVEWLSDSETLIFSEQSSWEDQMGTAYEMAFFRINIREGGLREVLRLPESVALQTAAALSPVNDMLVVSATEYALIPGFSGTRPVNFWDLSSSIRVSTTVLAADTGDIVLELPELFPGIRWMPNGNAMMTWDMQGVAVVTLETGDVQQLEFSGDAFPESNLDFMTWESDTVFLGYVGYGFQVEPSDFAIYAVDVATGVVTQRR